MNSSISRDVAGNSSLWPLISMNIRGDSSEGLSDCSFPLFLGGSGRNSSAKLLTDVQMIVRYRRASTIWSKFSIIQEKLGSAPNAVSGALPGFNPRLTPLSVAILSSWVPYLLLKFDQIRSRTDRTFCQFITDYQRHCHFSASIQAISNISLRCSTNASIVPWGRQHVKCA